MVPMTGAYAAPGDESEARGQVVSSDILGLQLLDAATSESGYPSEAGPNAEALNLALLEAIGLDLGPVQLPLIGTDANPGLLDLGQAGVLNSYASSVDAASSSAAAGAVDANGAVAVSNPDNPGTPRNATADLTALLGQVGVDGLTDQIVNDVRLELGALASTAQANGSTVASEYIVADAHLNVSSPAVGALTTDLGVVVTDLGTTIDGLISTEGALGSIANAVDIDVSLLGTGLEAGPAVIGVDGLDTALQTVASDVLTGTVTDSNGVVSIDLGTGTISVNLAALVNGPGAVDLNGLPANTQILTAGSIEMITTGVSEVLGDVAADLTAALTGVINTTELQIDVPVSVTALGIPAVDGRVLVTGTLGDFAGTSGTDPVVDPQVDLLGIPLGRLLDPLTDQLLTPLVQAAGSALTDLLGGVEPAINGLVNPLLATLDPVLAGVISQIVQVTVNEQPTPGAFGEGSFTVNALTLTLLPSTEAARVSLASSSVRATDVPAAEAAITANPGRVQDGGTTTVTGENFPANSDVELQLTDADGNPVGSPVTVTSNGSGEIEAELTVPAGTTAGEDYEITAEASDGTTASTPLAVTNDNQSDNTADNTDVNTEANTADNAADNSSPQIAVGPSQVEAGDPVRLEGWKFTPEGTATISIKGANGERVLLTDNQPVNADGEFVFDIDTAGLDSGLYRVEVIDNETGTYGLSSFTIMEPEDPTAANTEANTEVNTTANTDVNTSANTAGNTEADTDANPNGAQSSGTLALTGADGTGLAIGAGVLFLLTGIAGVVFARRRTTA